MLILNIKQMTSVFVDDSGSPLIDSRGNVLLLENKAEYVQSIMNAFKTLKYSETFMPPYGFDLQAILHIPQYIDSSTQVRAAALECLNPSYVGGVSSIEQIVATVNNEDKTVYLDISFVGDNGETYMYAYSFDVGE